MRGRPDSRATSVALFRDMMSSYADHDWSPDAGRRFPQFARLGTGADLTQQRIIWRVIASARFLSRSAASSYACFIMLGRPCHW